MGQQNEQDKREREREKVNEGGETLAAYHAHASMHATHKGGDLSRTLKYRSSCSMHSLFLQNCTSGLIQEILEKQTNK